MSLGPPRQHVSFVTGHVLQCVHSMVSLARHCHQAQSERGSTVGAANAAGVADLKQTWDELEPEGAFDLVPHCKLAKVYDPALSRLELVISVAQHREHIRGALGQTRANRLLGQAPCGALERALSAAIEQNCFGEFCRSITSRFTNQTPSATG